MKKKLEFKVIEPSKENKAFESFKLNDEELSKSKGGSGFCGLILSCPGLLGCPTNSPQPCPKYGIS